MRPFRFPTVSTPLLLLLILLAAGQVLAAVSPAAGAPKDLDTLREFPSSGSQKEWQTRAREIREQALVSCGLWPMPEKTALNPRIFGRVERDGYTIEKVCFETYPGFYLAGNLYRPLGQGKGPFPAILNPHGHWANGRMADESSGSIAGRCINFARQGMIAFTYDMVGYNDTHFSDTPTNKSFSDIHHQFATNPADLLWNVSLMGLQTWNSIRALDFLESLPDVNRKHLAITGESGGGTQTFMLGAIEDRLAAQAPVVMVSHSMQGGCLCENAPGLRVQFSNMEIAAAAAPRPQILVAASGDWTRDTLTIEGPSIARIYSLLNAREKFSYVRYDFNHNYNQTSREAVYGWFNRFLLDHGTGQPLPETPFKKEPDADLRVFPDGRLPDGAVTQDQLIRNLKLLHRKQWLDLLPNKKAGLARYKETFLPAWRHTVQLDSVYLRPEIIVRPPRDCGNFTSSAVTITRLGENAQMQGTYWAPAAIVKSRPARLAILCASDNQNQPPRQPGNPPPSLALQLLTKGVAVLELTQFSASTQKDQFSKYYCTYNRTLLQERVRDLLTACAAASMLDSRKNFQVTLVGAGRAGLWTLTAAPGAAAVVADCSRINSTDEPELLSHDLYCPGVLNLGGFEGCAILAAPKPLLLHNLGSDFSTTHLQTVYRGVQAPEKLMAQPQRLSDPEIADWIAHQR